MTEPKIEEIEDDGDEVVIIGEVMPKPMISYDKKKPKRQVEFKKSKFQNDSLVITQKVKVKKRKYHCVLKKSKVNIRSTPHLAKKNNNVNSSPNTKEKFERYAPVCFRKTCRDTRCKVESRIRRTSEKTKTERRHHCDFPRDLKRMLSPVSSSPLERDLSFDLEISLDTSSLQETRETKLDTLIKRTRDRDRKHKMTRTQHLCTPPLADISDQVISADKKMLDGTGCKPPITSTPKYEDNEDQMPSIAFSDINFTKPSKKDNSPSLEDIHTMFSPIKNPDNLSISKSTAFKEQGSRCFSSLLTDTNINDSKSEPVNAEISNTNYEQNIADTTIIISNNTKELSTGFCKDEQKQNKKTNVQTDMSNMNEHSVFSNKMLSFNNPEQSITKQPSYVEDKQKQDRASDNIQTVTSTNKGNNFADRISISNNYRDPTNKTCSLSLENTQIVQKVSEYTQTDNSDIDFERNITDTNMLVSDSIVKPINKNSFSEKLLVKQQSFDIQTIVTNTNELLIGDEKMVLCNDGKMLSIENPFSKDIQNKNEKDIPEMQTVIFDTNQELNIPNKNSMSFSYTNNNLKDQTCTTNNILKDNIQNGINEYSNTVNSHKNYDKNLEEIDMSISFDHIDKYTEQALAQSHTYEDANLQFRQSEYYMHNAVEDILYEKDDRFNRAVDFYTNCNRVVENSPISNSYNNLTEQQDIYRNPFIDDKHLKHKTYASPICNEQNNNYIQQSQTDSYSFGEELNRREDIKYDAHSNINFAYSNKYKQKLDDKGQPTFFNNYTEQRNKFYNNFFKESRLYSSSDIHSDSNRKAEQNRCDETSFPEDTYLEDRHNEPFFEDLYFYSNKKYEQSSDELNPIFYEKNSNGNQDRRRSPYFEYRQRKNIYFDYSIHSELEQIRNTSVSYYSNSVNNNENISQSQYSKKIHEQCRNSTYMSTSYSTKYHEQNIDNNNFKGPARQSSPFFGAPRQHKKYKYSTKAYNENIDDEDLPSYKSDNFRKNPSKRHSPFIEVPRHKKYKFIHTNDSDKYNDQKMKERKIFKNKNSYFEDKRNRVAKEDDNYQNIQHAKPTYKAVSKKKVEIFIDKRMSDEAYEDVLVGLSPGRVSPDLH